MMLVIKIDEITANSSSTGSGVPRFLIAVRICKKCNARCAMCDFWKSEETMPWKEIESIINQAAELNAQEICFTGGEPTAHPNFYEAISAIREKNIGYSFITNGSGLEFESVKKIMGHPPTRVFVSIDSPHAQIHDRIRGTEGLWRRAMDGILFFNQFFPRPKIIINCVVSNQNFQELPELVALSQGFLFDELNLIPIKGMPQWRLNREQIQFYNHSVVPVVRKALTMYGVRLRSGNPHIFGLSEEEISNSTRGEYSKLARKGGSECLVSGNMLFIETNGDVFPCNNTPYYGSAFRMGNAFVERLLRILQSEQARDVQKLVDSGTLCITCDPANQAINQGAALRLRTPCIANRGDGT